MKLPRKILIAILLTAFLVAVFAFWYSRSPERIVEIIRDFDPADLKSLNFISKINRWGADAIPMLENFVKSESLSERLALVLSLSELLKKDESLATSVVQFLVQLKNEEDDNLRMLIGAELISLGKKEGIPTLISCLESEEPALFEESGKLVKEKE